MNLRRGRGKTTHMALVVKEIRKEANESEVIGFGWYGKSNRKLFVVEVVAVGGVVHLVEGVQFGRCCPDGGCRL